MPARFTRLFLGASFAVAALAGVAPDAWAQIPGDTIKIGVLSDFSGPFADQVGKGSLVGAQLAAEDFAKEAGALKVEVIYADHQNKPDIGVAIARRWVDAEGVDAIVDLANSGVGLAVNTLMHEKNRAMLASATGALGATLWMWWFKTKKPDPSMMCNGMLAGLVAITCPCAFVDAGGASILGLIAGVLCVESVFFFEKHKIDDSVGAISVHGVNGAWGCLSLGLFADGTYGDGWNGVPGTVKGLFYGGGMGQFWAELVGVTVCFITLSIISIIVYFIAEKLVGNRVSKEVEIAGLDLPEMGAPGYSGFVFDKAAETPVQ